MRPGFFPVPLPCRRLGALSAEASHEFVDDALPVALARSFTAERAMECRFDADKKEDAHHLPLKRLAKRVEFSDRPPRQDLAAAIEAFASGITTSSGERERRHERIRSQGEINWPGGKA